MELIKQQTTKEETFWRKLILPSPIPNNAVDPKLSLVPIAQRN
jgi:hypothetical protein